jgi:transcription elongation GreA/GreB family factor
VRLTPEGRDALQDRLERLRTEVLAPLGVMLGDPDHDRRIDDDYDRAFAEATHLEQLLAEAASIQPPEDPDVVALGSSVQVRFADGSVEHMRLVHPAEAFLDDERVSLDAPVAQALLGHRGGDVVDVVAPVGRMSVEVVAVRQPTLVAG